MYETNNIIFKLVQQCLIRTKPSKSRVFLHSDMNFNNMKYLNTFYIK